MVADDVFDFACSIIQKAVEDQVTCSILFSLVTKEDCILDAKTLCRANRDGQVGGARDLEESIITLTSEMAANSERESVIHLRSDNPLPVVGEIPPKFRESCILEYFASDYHCDAKAPTPLHEVGTWRMPHDPSCSSKIRIVDAAIQAFSATFGLKDGKEQQHAMLMLESLIPPFLSQLARTIGLNSTAIDNERRGKVCYRLLGLNCSVKPSQYSGLKETIPFLRRPKKTVQLLRISRPSCCPVYKHFRCMKQRTTFPSVWVRPG